MPTPRTGRRVEFQPLTPGRWDDLVTLFGPRGACAGCWCMWPRLTRPEFQRGQGAGNRRAFRRVVAAGPPPGVLAYVDGEAAGWCAVAPRERLPRLERGRVLKRVDDQPVWSVTCFFVARPHRARGLTVPLLREAVKLARRHGGRVIEGYPVDPRAGRMADVFVWTGLASAFRRAGFREVLRRSPTRPIMRYAVGRAGRPANSPRGTLIP